MRERKKDDFNVATGINYSVASSLSWSTSICNPEMGITRIRGASRNTASLERMDADKLVLTYVPHGQAPRFPHGWLKISGSPGYPTYDRVDHRW